MCTSLDKCIFTKLYVKVNCYLGMLKVIAFLCIEVFYFYKEYYGLDHVLFNNNYLKVKTTQ